MSGDLLNGCFCHTNPALHTLNFCADAYFTQNFKIGMVGDLLNGRTVHSLAYVLSMFKGVKMYFVAPKVSVNFTL
jgi:aspartate carbamoyltransferase catalytic subunit